MASTQEKRGVLAKYLKEWSIEKLKSLTLEEYVVGNENYKETLSYWLETPTNILGGIGGLGGGGAFKYGVYFMTNPTDYSSHNIFNSDNEYAWRRKLGDSADEAFQNMKNKIIEIVEAANTNKFHKIDIIDFPYSPLKWKLAFLYSDEKIPLIYQEKALRLISRKLGIVNPESIKISDLYALLMSKKEENETVYDFSDRLWQIYEEDKDVNYYILGSKYGDNGEHDILRFLLEKNIVATGFYHKEDLSKFYLKSSKEIVDYLKKQGEHTRSYSALKYFLNIKVGDKIAIKSDGSPKGNEGYLKIVGFAEVVERNGKIYQFDDKLGHTLNVDFIEAPINLELSLGGYGRTIHKLSKQNHIKMIFENNNYTIENFIYEYKGKKKMNHTLNQILFGPPGTGKTYQTRKLAYEIIKNEKLSDSKEDFEKSLQLFKDLKSDQIEFITFHQNYSYEDFVQGLRPDVDNESSSGLKFKLHNGIFYKIAKRAKENYLKSKNTPKDIEIPFEDVFAVFSEPYFKDEKEISVSMKNAEFFITEITSTHLKFRKQSGGTSHDLVVETLRGIYNKTRDFNKAGLGVYYYPLFERLKVEAEKLKNQIKVEPLKNYVLIIDEINRANISRVFGELITLLEPSKRFGKAEEIEVQLPSGDRFVVPPNLYIIGTMNTADKSIALLDIALRRRFDFVPVFPDKSLVCEEYQDLFDKLNTKIAKLKSPDFTIGHSYFMKDEDGKVPDLKSIMNNKVIPLLGEYFMNDLKRVESLLKEIGVETKTEHYGILRFDNDKTQGDEND